MLDFERFDFNTKGDKITITDTRTGDSYTGNRAEYAKNVKTGYYGGLLVAGIYGIGAGLLMAAKSHQNADKRLQGSRKTKTHKRRITSGIARLAFWK